MERYHTFPAGTRLWGEELYVQTQQSTGDWKMAIGTSSYIYTCPRGRWLWIWNRTFTDLGALGQVTFAAHLSRITRMSIVLSRALGLVSTLHNLPARGPLLQS